MESKPLTPAQAEHLAGLIAQRDQIEAEINRFVSYLSIEHKASVADGWTHCTPEHGFTRGVPAGSGSDGGTA